MNPQTLLGGAKAASATFSKDKLYRYTLERVWDSEKPLVAFVGLNPSTADEVVDDPTIKRCISFAQSWGFGGLVMLNLFAYRSTKRERLRTVKDPVGPDNDWWIQASLHQVEKVVVCWGNDGELLGRDMEVLNILGEVYCLGHNKTGRPKHPLYLNGDIELRMFRSVSDKARSASKGDIKERG